MFNYFAVMMDSFSAAYNNLSANAQIAVLILSCLIPTIVIEALFARLFKVKGQNLLIVILAQIITNPIVVLTTNIISLKNSTSSANDFQNTFIIAMVAMEIFAFLVEALMYKFFFKDYKFLNPFLLSFLLNLFSVVFGFALQSIMVAF